ncbi:MAG: hypothetical protein M0P31_13615 [Solirubrobacteraceae bacterium]|nr:hypothetical protein [Solirubrobacteraceae bacterium]
MTDARNRERRTPRTCPHCGGTWTPHGTRRRDPWAICSACITAHRLAARAQDAGLTTHIVHLEPLHARVRAHNGDRNWGWIDSHHDIATTDRSAGTRRRIAA